MQARKLDTTRARDVRQFIDFPFELYRECPQWVPPVLPEIKLVLNRYKHPFYRHSDASLDDLMGDLCDSAGLKYRRNAQGFEVFVP